MGLTSGCLRCIIGITNIVLLVSTGRINSQLFKKCKTGSSATTQKPRNSVAAHMTMGLFLPRDAMYTRDLRRRPVCASLSVRHVRALCRK